MEHTGMGRLLGQMLGVVLLLGVLCAWNMQREVPVMAPEDGVSLPVIMYHSILKDEARAGAYVLSPAALAADLDYLKQRGYETVTVRQLVDYVDHAGALPEKPVLLTFDDGFYNNYSYAYPLLKERGMQALVSVIGQETETYTENGTENAYWSYLSAQRLLEMQDVFEIGNHSYAMHETNRRKGCVKKRGEDVQSYHKLLTEDTQRTQQLLQTAGVPVPLCYAYPYGAYSSDTEQVLKDLGFRCTLSCEERQNRITRSPDCLYLLGRYNRPSGISTSAFFAKALPEGS